MKTIYIFLFIVFLGFFQACDKIDNPHKEGDFVWNGRKIIIYDFTGHLCENCPNAHLTLKKLQETYKDAIIPIAIHCTPTYSNPRVGSSKFYYDFRTDIGIALGGGGDIAYGHYGQLNLPTGLVNSLAIESLSGVGNWTSEARKNISSYPEFLIELEGSFSQADSTISCNVQIVTSIENTRKLSLTVFLLEDGIIQWQKNKDILPGGEEENYEHNHILRAGFNGAFGENIKTDNNMLNFNDRISKAYSLSAASHDWNISKCSIVAFVYDTDTKEILQGEVIYLE